MIKTQNLLLPILIGLVILPRLSVDLYLPALTEIGIRFHASDDSLRMTLTIFMIGYALSMLIAGSLVDIFGSKNIINYGLGLFFLATLVSIASTSMTILIISRFFQALGGCCGTLVARIMVKEFYSRDVQIKILAQLASTMAICPLFIPILGGTLQTYFGWKANFVLLGLFGFLLLCLFSTQIKSQPISYQRFSIKQLLHHYHFLLTNKLFIGYSIAIGCAWCNYFAFTMESPFIFQKILNYSSFSYGLLIALTVIGYLIGIRLTKQYADVIGWDRLIYVATFVCLFGALIMVSLLFIFTLNWLTIVLPMMIIMIGVGIIIPCAQGAVMQPFAHMTGTASGLFFFIQMLFGVICGLTLQSFSHSSAFPMAIIILCSSTLLVLTFSLFGNYTNEFITLNQTP